MPAHVNSSNAEWCLFTGLPLWRETDTVGDSKADNPKKLLKKWPDGVFASPWGGITPQLCKVNSPQMTPIAFPRLQVCT